jgi:predicted nucleic acid-binding protein
MASPEIGQNGVMNRPSVYIESSVVSYLTARPSRDVVALAHQKITRLWWKKCLPQYDVYISEVVLEEVRRGDPEAAVDRAKAVLDFPLLPIIPGVEALAAVYARELQYPEHSLRDALHIALASVHGVDYLVTWNCTHIANAHVRPRLAAINTNEGVPIPVICTPEELLDD